MSNKITGFVFEKIGLPQFEAFLDLSAYSHKLTSGNVANVSTPGYRAESIDFQKEFSRLTGESRRLVGTLTRPDHIPLGQHQHRGPKVDQARTTQGELNAVDIDHEISNMARNELEFTIAAQLLQRKFQGLKKAINSK
ncbi:MAG: flagellar basal body rod protein FlgB [candidate division Zixibacteria bacterium]|nr:flagellar basal body rod protein FlgB [candidate division Zixibacteria bacterium]